MSDQRAAIRFEDAQKVYPNGVHALKDVNLEIKPGEFVVVVGLSGAGKSTLVRSINGLVKLSGGGLFVGGTDLTKAGSRDLKRLRRDVGMVFQNYNIVRRSSVMRNVLAGRLGYTGTFRSLVGAFSREDKQLALDSLDRLGIADKARARADELSGGQQQRVSIARALTQRPRIMLADEPVASLDPPTSHAVMKDLKRINREDGITTIVNLHFIDLATEYGDRIVGMRGGEVVYDGPAAGADESTFEEIYGRGIREDDLRGQGGDDEGSEEAPSDPRPLDSRHGGGGV
ncbi:MAG: phosphonate ABC transporter ATP-binding protein [Rubrobacteraceae bacterium]